MRSFVFILILCIILNNISIIECLAEEKYYYIQNPSIDFVINQPLQNEKESSEQNEINIPLPIIDNTTNNEQSLTEYHQQNTTDIKEKDIQTTEYKKTLYTEPPKWEEYVPKKYRNPRYFPKKGKHMTELIIGAFLTNTVWFSPIGIPMIYHSVTKMKNHGWYKNKQKFEKGLIEAEKIQDPIERKKYYKKLLSDCHMTEKRHKKIMKREHGIKVKDTHKRTNNE